MKVNPKSISVISMRYISLCLFIVLCPYGQLQAGTIFDNLQNILEYAKTLPESPKNESGDLFRPSFNLFNKAHKTTYKDRFLAAVGLKKGLNLNVDYFFKLLHDITMRRQLEGYGDDFVQKFFLDGKTSWFIWGPLYGAFHSLVRSLEALRIKNIIDDSLKIIQPTTYLVFSGDAASYSPYGLESLLLLMQLLERNPKNVFLLKSSKYQAESISIDNLINELQMRFNASTATLNNDLQLFLNTLPLALYLMGSEGQIIRISDSFDEGALNDTQWAYFFENKMNGITKIKDIELSDDTVKINGLIEFYRASGVPQRIDRLRYSNDESIHKWTFFSSPVEPFKSMFQFHYDSFIVLSTNKYFSNWKLGLFAQDLNVMNGFAKIRLFDVATGQEIFSLNPVERIEYFEQQITVAKATEEKLKQACKFKKHEKEVKPLLMEQQEDVLKDNILVIGNSTDFSKSLKKWSKLLKDGMILPIEYVNDHNGIDGINIQIIFLDDLYDPKQARNNIENLLKDFKSDILLGANGTATLNAYIDLIKEKKVLSVFPNTGSFRDPQLSYLLHFGASYKNEGYAVTKYAQSLSNVNRFAFFYQKDGYGQDLLKGAQEFLELIEGKTVLEVSYEPYSIDISEQAKQIKDFKPDVIAFFSLPGVTQKLIGELGSDFLRNKLFVGNNRLGDQAFSDFLTERSMVIIVPQLVPNPKTSQIQLVQEFREQTHSKGLQPEATTLLGYIEASLFLDILTKIGKPFSKKRIIEFVESIDNYDFKGLRFSFDPATRQLYHVIWIDNGTQDWIEQAIEFQKKPLGTQKDVLTSDKLGNQHQTENNGEFI